MQTWMVAYRESVVFLLQCIFCWGLYFDLLLGIVVVLCWVYVKEKVESHTCETIWFNVNTFETFSY